MTIGVPMVNFVGMVFFFQRVKRVRAIWTEKDFDREQCMPWGVYLERALIKADVVDDQWIQHARKEYSELDRNKDGQFCRDDVALKTPMTWITNKEERL